MTASSFPRVRIYHHSLWAKYKGVIFSRIHADSERSRLATSFIQVVETTRTRAVLGGVDHSYHQYPYQLLFHGYDEDIPAYKLVLALIGNLLKNPCELVVLPGYHRAEYWAMLATCMVLRRKRGVCVDSTAYDRSKSRLKEAAKRFFFRRCDGFFCYGIRSKEYVASYGIDERMIFHPCQAAALPHGYSAATIRSHYATRPRASMTAPRFLYIGRLSKEKGLDDLLEAFSHVRLQIPEARLDIVGAGPLESEIKERAKQRGLDAVVEFLGSKSPEEIGQLLLRSAALILPSHSEPWGLVVNEALSYGCPCVVSNVCGCVPELVQEGRTGFSYPVGDVPALGAAMISVAELCKQRPFVANNCIDLIEQYTAERAATEILNGCIRVINTPQ
jgi:glycosyltransferase involved in cell wall biosynthesis